MIRAVKLNLCSEVADYERDVGTARCRLPSLLQRDLGATLQSLVEVRMWSSQRDYSRDNDANKEEQYFDVLCVVYPDTQHVLREDEICIDDSVVLSSTSVRVASPASRCEILRIHSPMICSAVYVTPENVAPRSLLGLPVGENCRVMPNRAYRSEEVNIYRINLPSQRKGELTRKVGLVGMNTVLISKSRVEMKDENVEGAHDDAIHHCHTMAVDEIIKRVVRPLACIPKCAQTSGVLLLGPAGVGKTSAIRAVKTLCAAWCTIDVIDMSIPEILADREPEQKLLSLLAAAENAINSPVSSTTEEQQQQSSMILPPPVSPQIIYRSPGKDATQNRHSTFSFLTPSPSESAGKGRGTSVVDTLSKDAGTVPPLLQLRILFLDEVDALGTTDNQSEVQRVVTQSLCSWFDDKKRQNSSLTPPCCVLATSNRSGDVCSSLKRGGRLELEVNITSSHSDRFAISRHLLTRQRDDENVDNSMENIDALANHLADRTGGYVAADMVALISKAAELRSLSAPTSMTSAESWKHCVDMAMNSVPPSCLRGVAIKTPSIGYEDVVGNEETKQTLKRVLRFFSPDMWPKMAQFGLQMPGGVLLHGPPGNSKTRLVMAAASHHRLPVIFLSAADVYSPYVGDSEAEVRKAFSVARQAAPCVLFLDELDAFVTNRDTGDSGGTSGSVEARVLATLLTEMDGIGYREDASYQPTGASAGVAVMAATNRLGAIDSALLRKGRFHHVLYVPAPDERTRGLLLEYFSVKCHLTSNEMERTREKLRNGMCGADVENLCREARLERIRVEMSEGRAVV